MTTHAVRGSDGGGGIPRAASPGSTQIVAGVGLALLAFSPIAVVVAVATVALVLRQVRRHWWEVAAVAAGVLVVAGLVTQLVTGNVLAFHFAGYLDALRGTTSWAAVAVRNAVLGVPMGITAGALYVGASERWSGRAEWHPIEQRRRTVNDERQERHVAGLVANPWAAKLCPTAPLGVSRGGDLTSWTHGDFVCLPTGSFPAMGVLGEAGSGKTVTLERLVTLWARAGRKVIFADFKGSDPELPARVVAAYKTVRPDAACGLWPAMPLDIWRGNPDEIANRLLQVQDFSEPYYETVAETVVRLVMTAPDVDGSGPVTDSTSFLRRLDGAFLSRAWEGRREATVVADLLGDRKALAGVRLRYEGFFSALAGRLDHGFSFEDSDLAVLTVPTLAKPKDAMAVARMVLADFGAYCLTRKPRVGEDVTFIVDEFSAVTEAAPMVTTLAERVRDVGGQVVVSAQSYEGLGRTADERARLMSSLLPGGLVVHRLADPEPVCTPAGTVRATENSWQLSEDGSTGLGTTKMSYRLRVELDKVRQARTGEAWAITHGRAQHMSVLRTRIPLDVLEHARRLVEFARLQAEADLAAGRVAEAQEWWEVRLPEPVVVGPGPRPRGELEEGADMLALPGGSDPEPKALPPAPPLLLPDPRLVLGIAYAVRAGLVAHARALAQLTKGIDDPEVYVQEVMERRARQVAEARRRRRRR